MKKLLCIILCIVLILCIVACGDGNEIKREGNEKQLIELTEKKEDATEMEQSEDPTVSATEPKIIADPESGVVLQVDLSIRGEIAEDAPSIHENQFILEGHTVEMPIAMSAMYEIGWNFTDPKYEQIKDFLMKPKRTTALISYELVNGENQKINLVRVYNEADTEKTIDFVSISELFINTNYFYMEPVDLVLPGGITMRSSAADIFEAFGEPENNPYFDRVYVHEYGVSYYNHKDNGLTYSFSFYNDEDAEGKYEGLIYSLQIRKDY